jgi:hypothetical protein
MAAIGHVRHNSEGASQGLRASMLLDECLRPGPCSKCSRCHNEANIRVSTT